ncbi:Trypanosome variant surface glycoprotein (A-type), putative [Trypanosoma equiperdum]|uniref:Trypanosome variant surface glycoprotein (A-type), putative n=1 Tax=Trypanosoma equiperdum TaxID=5694 RepID=A0A1G4I9M1_TRYEQ|nr:Trypanosome variant surface glycoprotein (A-type), putative [Trypanosoma equiperdum]
MLLYLLLLAQICATAKLSQRANYALKGTVWIPPCQLVRELRKTAEAVNTKLTSHMIASDTLDLLIAKITLYSEKQPLTKEATTLRAVSAAAAVEKQAASSYTKQNLKAALDATAYTSELSGAITAAVDTLYHAAGTTNYCLGDKAGTGDGKAQVAATQCQAPGIVQHEGNGIIDSTIVNANGFPKITGATTTAGRGTASQCGFFETKTGVTANPGILIGGNARAQLAFGLIKATTATNPIGDSLTNIKQGEHSTDTTFFQRVHTAAQTAINLRIATATKIDEATIKRLATSNAAMEALKKILSARESKKPKDFDGQTETLKTTWFGDDGAKAWQAWEKAKDDKVINPTTAAEDDTTIESITNVGDIYGLLAHYAELRNSKFLQTVSPGKRCKESEESSNNKNKDNCGKNSIRKDCTGETGCEFDETKTPKCFPKPEEKTEKTEKKDRENGKTTSTNTTGSNSFVINKAPIFLAFLVL